MKCQIYEDNFFLFTYGEPSAANVSSHRLFGFMCVGSGTDRFEYVGLNNSQLKTIEIANAHTNIWFHIEMNDMNWTTGRFNLRFFNGSTETIINGMNFTNSTNHAIKGISYSSNLGTNAQIDKIEIFNISVPAPPVSANFNYTLEYNETIEEANNISIAMIINRTDLNNSNVTFWWNGTSIPVINYTIIVSTPSTNPLLLKDVHNTNGIVLGGILDKDYSRTPSATFYIYEWDDSNLFGYRYLDTDTYVHDTFKNNKVRSKLKLYFQGNDANMNITAGEYITIRYDNGTSPASDWHYLNVSLPNVSMGIGATLDLYMADDGSTYYDGALTEIAQTASNVSTTNSTVFNASVIPPLLDTNKTNISFYWEYNLTFSDAKNISNTSTYNQSIIFYAIPTSWNFNDPTYVGYNPISYRLLNTLVTYSNVELYWFIYNYTPTITGTLYSYNANDQIPTDGMQINFSTTFNVTDGTRIKERNYTRNQSIYLTSLLNCSDTDNYTLRVTGKNEDNRSNITFNLEADFLIWSVNESDTKNFTFQLEDNSAYYFCINPPNANYTTEAFFQYNATAHLRRDRWLWDYTLISFDNLSLFMLETDRGTNVYSNVVDENDNPLKGYFVGIQRYYAGIGEYRTVEYDKTNWEGESVHVLNPNEAYYKFTVYDANGIAMFDTDRTQIYNTEYIFRIVIQEDPLEEFKKYRDITSYVYFDNTTKEFVCEYNDISDLTKEGCLRVTKLSAFGETQKCRDCAFSSATTLTCNATDYWNATGRYMAECWIDTHRENTNIKLGDVELLNTDSPFGDRYGIFLSILWIGVLTGVGAWSPVALLFFFMLGLLTSGILQLNIFAYIVYSGTGIIAALIMYNLRSK